MSGNWVQRKETWLCAVAARVHEWLPLAVACLLAKHFNWRSGRAFPSVGTMASELGSSRRGIQRAFGGRLLDAGVLKQVPDRHLARGLT